MARRLSVPLPHTELLPEHLRPTALRLLRLTVPPRNLITHSNSNSNSSRLTGSNRNRATVHPSRDTALRLKARTAPRNRDTAPRSKVTELLRGLHPPAVTVPPRKTSPSK